MVDNSQQPVVQPNNSFANAVGMILVVFLCTLTVYLTYKIVNVTGDIPQNLAFVCGQLLGFLTAKLSTMVDWSFSGTATTKKQGDVIAQQAANLAALAPTSTTTTITGTVTPAANPVVATVETPSVTVPLHKNETTTVTASPVAPPKPPGT